MQHLTDQIRFGIERKQMWQGFFRKKGRGYQYECRVHSDHRHMPPKSCIEAVVGIPNVLETCQMGAG